MGGNIRNLSRRTNDLVYVVKNNTVYYPFSTEEIYTIEDDHIYRASTRDGIYRIKKAD